MPNRIQVPSCVCGECRTCYKRRWRALRRTVGGPQTARCTQEWFDWEEVLRRWAAWCDGEAQPAEVRKPTTAERHYLASLAVLREWTPESMGRLLGMRTDAAEAVALDVLEGRVQVPARDWQGKPAIRTTPQ